MGAEEFHESGRPQVRGAVALVPRVHLGVGVQVAHALNTGVQASMAERSVPAPPKKAGRQDSVWGGGGGSMGPSSVVLNFWAKLSCTEGARENFRSAKGREGNLAQTFNGGWGDPAPANPLPVVLRCEKQPCRVLGGWRVTDSEWWV